MSGFWDRIRTLGGETESPVKTELPGPVFPTSEVPECMVGYDQLRVYEELSKSLGFKPSELVRTQLLEYFEQEGIKLYCFDEVDAWLRDKAKQASARLWYWRPLRKRDIITEYLWGQREEHGQYNSDYWRCRPYDRLVPTHALKKVSLIEAKFNKDVKFFVSDFAAINADPFIMVRPATCGSGRVNEYHLVFDFWDEPGFGA